MGFDFDLLVIGAGSGGVRAARMAAAQGAQVGICEESRVGGTCVIRGCIPKKLLVYAAHFGQEFADAGGFGWQLEKPRFDWPRLIANKDREIDRLNGVYKRTLSDHGVTLFEARGVLEDANTVSVGTRRVTAKIILVAVGGWPFKPDTEGVEHAITSNEALHLERLPRRILIVGGGYIAVEFAGIFNGLGSEVMQAYRGPLLLRGFDADVRQHLDDEMLKQGVAIRYDTVVAAIEKRSTGLTVRFDDGHSQEFDAVMYAVGRRPKVAGLGLRRVGVACDDLGAIVVDAYSRTSVPSIYAVGDVTNRMNLTPVALMEGQAFAATVFGGQPTPVDHQLVPCAVFSQPPVAAVGLSEEQARLQYPDVAIYRSRFKPLRNSLSGRDEYTMMKLVVDSASQRVLGCHIVGLDAPEMLQGTAIAIKMGATKKQFDATIGIHPTAAEELVTMRNRVE